MPTRNIVLTDQQDLFIEQMVASGRYQNASEVLREGLRLIYQREKEEAMRLQALQSLAVVNILDVATPEADYRLTLSSDQEIQNP